MRVISGERKGHPLKAVPGELTRPTTDKVKEAIFSMIGPYFDGGIVLDAFSGTGSLAIEALSRGMDYAYLYDVQAKSIQIMKENLEKTKYTQQATVTKGDVTKNLSSFYGSNVRFDLVFIDPPYKNKIYEQILSQLIELKLLANHAIIVVESDPKQQDLLSLFSNWHHIKRAQYGGTCIDILKPLEEGNEQI